MVPLALRLRCPRTCRSAGCAFACDCGERRVVPRRNRQPNTLASRTSSRQRCRYRDRCLHLERGDFAIAASFVARPGGVRNKVASANDDKRHHLALAEAIGIVTVSKDHGLIHAICHEFDGEFLRHPGHAGATDEELLARFTSMMKELGHFLSDIHKSLADGKITRGEIATLRRDFLRLSRALSEIRRRLEERASKDLDAQHKKLLSATS
jgi:hypothetical protein